MTENGALEMSKSVAQSEVDEFIDGLRKLGATDVDEARVEWLRERMTVGLQLLRDVLTHYELGLALPPALMTRAKFNHEQWKIEFLAGAYRQQTALSETISSLSEMEGRAPLSTASSVPSAAETVISYVCTPDRLEAVLGDLERNFARRAAKHGETEARRWYWWQTARTVAAFSVQTVVKVVMARELLRKLGL